MATGLKRDHQGAAPGRFAGLRQGAHLGVGLTGTGVKSLTHEPAGVVQHHGPDQGIGAGLSLGQRRPVKGPAHPPFPHQLRGSV